MNILVGISTNLTDEVCCCPNFEWDAYSQPKYSHYFCTKYFKSNLTIALMWLMQYQLPTQTEMGLYRPRRSTLIKFDLKHIMQNKQMYLGYALLLCYIYVSIEHSLLQLLFGKWNCMDIHSFVRVAMSIINVALMNNKYITACIFMLCVLANFVL